MKKIKKTKEQFVFESIEKYGDFLDYSRVEYLNCKAPVEILCPIHGSFLITPDAFLHRPNTKSKTNGCAKCSQEECGKNQRVGSDLFSQQAAEIHGDKYDYSLVDYKKNDKKVKIICKKHGEFLQTPSNHKFGKGCPECKKENNRNRFKMPTEEFISKSKKIHGDLFNYDLVNYTNCDSKVLIKCNKHDLIFSCSPYHHIRGTNSCPKCRHTSIESFVESFLIKLKLNYEKNNRSIIYPLEIDFFVKELNIGIECNGNFWHSERQGKDDSYHFNKFKKCQDESIRLIQIFENEIIHSKSAVISVLNSAFSVKKRVPCDIKQINSKLYKKFSNKYSLKNNQKSKYIGFFYKNKLVCSVSYSNKNKGRIEIYDMPECCLFAPEEKIKALVDFLVGRYNCKTILFESNNRFDCLGQFIECGFELNSHESPKSYLYTNKSKKTLDEYSGDENKIWDAGSIRLLKKLN